MKQLAQGIKEEEDGEMEEDRDTIGQASHLKFGKAVEEIGTDSATFMRSGTWL